MIYQSKPPWGAGYASSRPPRPLPETRTRGSRLLPTPTPLDPLDPLDGLLPTPLERPGVERHPEALADGDDVLCRRRLQGGPVAGDQSREGREYTRRGDQSREGRERTCLVCAGVHLVHLGPPEAEAEEALGCALGARVEARPRPHLHGGLLGLDLGLHRRHHDRRALRPRHHGLVHRPRGVLRAAAKPEKGGQGGSRKRGSGGKYRSRVDVEGSLGTRPKVKNTLTQGSGKVGRGSIGQA
eukprot:1186507-Prorocentrum_minimum.AAC.2